MDIEIREDGQYGRDVDLVFGIAPNHNRVVSVDEADMTTLLRLLIQRRRGTYVGDRSYVIGHEEMELILELLGERASGIRGGDVVGGSWTADEVDTLRDGLEAQRNA